MSVSVVGSAGQFDYDSIGEIMRDQLEETLEYDIKCNVTFSFCQGDKTKVTEQIHFQHGFGTYDDIGEVVRDGIEPQMDYDSDFKFDLNIVYIK